jgi:SAM-dependent methyltransferase
MQAYWDARFRLEGRVWGDAPSRTAEYAREAFAREGLRTVLVPGAGYGRNAALFAAAGFRVVGVEISPEALRLARRGAASEAYVRGTVLALPIRRCDAIYCFNVLHLLRLPERKQLVAACRACLAEGGLAFFAVFSEREPSYGRGREVERTHMRASPAGRCTTLLTPTCVPAWRDGRSATRDSWRTPRTTARRALTPTWCATSSPVPHHTQSPPPTRLCLHSSQGGWA